MVGLCAALWLLPAGGVGQEPTGTGAPAGRPRPLTVEESVRLALEHAPAVRMADADAAAAGAVAREASAALLPSLRGAASYTRLGGDIPEATFSLPGLDTTFTLLPIERDRFSSEFGVTQALFTGGRLRGQARSAERQSVAAGRRAAQARVDVAFEVRAAYWTLYAAAAALAATEAADAQVAAHLEAVRALVAEGAALRSELLAAQTRRSEVALDRLDARNTVRLAQLELNRHVGLPLDTDVRPTDEVALEPLDVDVAGFVARATASLPHLQALAEEVSALRAELAVADGGRWPEVSFVSRYVYARPNPYVITEQDAFRGTWEAGLSLQWGVWEGGARAARQAQAAARIRGAEARLEAAEDQAAVAVHRRYLEALRSTEAVTVAAEHVAHAEEALRVAREQFAEGVARSAHVLDAEQAWRAAQARHARALAEYATARAALGQAVGVVW